MSNFKLPRIIASEKNNLARVANVHRKTNETDIKASLNLDGIGDHHISTGIGFFDHMLQQLAKHSLMNIDLKAKGDLHIDYHHTVEDVGITLGKCFSQALADKKGITRYSHISIPMDETLIDVAVDVSGRHYLVWNVDFTRDKIGDFDTELFEEWFRAFAFAAGITLHINLRYGKNNHHIIESCYKGLAISLKQAITIDSRTKELIPSTKGVI